MENASQYLDDDYNKVKKPRLLDQMRDRIRVKHYSLRTENSYLDWVKRYIFFHNKRHPAEMGAPEVESFLTYLAVDRNVSASTQNQALAAILFLYKEVLAIELPWLQDVTRAKRTQRLPVVLTRGEVDRVLAQLEGTSQLIAKLLYGTGMRLMEMVRLRIKDIDFERREIIVWSEKGDKDRVTMLPEVMIPPLRDHLIRVRALFDKDRAENLAGVYLPHAL